MVFSLPLLSSKLKSEKIPKTEKEKWEKLLTVKRGNRELLKQLATLSNHDSMSRENQWVKNEHFFFLKPEKAFSGLGALLFH